MKYDIKSERAIIQQMASYPLKPGQALYLGPLSVAFLAGDYVKAPWVIPNGPKAPGGKRLPDLRVLERNEWTTK